MLLLGLRHRNETTPGALTKVSMGGGLEMFIDGAGFDDMPKLNQVKFKTVQGEAKELVGPALNRKCQRLDHHTASPWLSFSSKYRG